MRSHHPTRWARNKQHKFQLREVSVSGHHPTRWARNWKASRESGIEGGRSHHPTRWARNFYDEEDAGLKAFLSPSHTVGSEPITNSIIYAKATPVTIPHGGLGTRFGQKAKRGVGKSPSHTVGLEPSPAPCGLGLFFFVTIPHGGLGTPNHHIKQNKTYQSFCQGSTSFK